ncbi:helix-turn-helix domain-containing protein, partial [Chloroflexota bacterium]
MRTGEFAARLRELRERANLSQGELADKVGINFTYLNKIENGVKPPPREKVILALAKALNTDSDELMVLAGKVPADIVEISKKRETWQLLGAGLARQENRFANKKESFHIKLKELRQQASLSQRGLADKVGINFTYLNKIESGVMPPPSERIVLRLVDALNADRDELMTLAGKVPADIAQILKKRETWQLLRAGQAQKKTGTATKKEGFSIIMKQLINYKRISKVALPVVLTCAIAASWWFAGPLPVEALSIAITDPEGQPLEPATIGQDYHFQVKVTIEDYERLPIQNINLYIYNSANRSSYSANITNLPLIDGDSANYTGGWGTVTVTANATDWVQSFGYGYVVWQGYGYTFPQGYGYGGPASISMAYDIVWTPPIEWPVGNYQVETEITANGVTFTETSDVFTISTGLVAETSLAEGLSSYVAGV